MWVYLNFEWGFQLLTTTDCPYFFSMAANPIFPLYYNDIDRSTRDWTDEEFGCYMRLLMHQWDKGEIPKDPQRLSRIVTSLASSWVTVGLKFASTDTGFFNARLEEIRKEREAFLKKQSENGKKGGRKPKINPTTNPKQNPKQSLHIEDEIEIEDEKEIENNKGGAGGNFLIPQMCSVWYESFPTYTKDQKRDYQAMFRVMAFMGQQAGVLNLAQHPEHWETAIDTLKQIIAVIQTETFWINKPLSSIANSIQEFYNKIKNPQHEQRNSKTTKQSNSNLRDDVQAAFEKRFGGKQ